MNQHLSPRTIREWLELIPYDRARKEAIENYENNHNIFVLSKTRREPLAIVTTVSEALRVIVAIEYGFIKEKVYISKLEKRDRLNKYLKTVKSGGLKL